MTINGGQTTIEPCAICSEPAERTEELIPPLYKQRGGKQLLIKAAVHRWLCAAHLEAIERDRNWQQRQAESRRKERQAMKAAQAENTLFDPGDRRWQDQP